MATMRRRNVVAEPAAVPPVPVGFVANIRKTLPKLDVYPKLDEEHRVRTQSGAALSLVMGVRPLPPGPHAPPARPRAHTGASPAIGALLGVFSEEHRVATVRARRHLGVGGARALPRVVLLLSPARRPRS